MAVAAVYSQTAPSRLATLPPCSAVPKTLPAASTYGLPWGSLPVVVRSKSASVITVEDPAGSSNRVPSPSPSSVFPPLKVVP